MTKRIALAMMLVAGTAATASAQDVQATASVATISEFNGTSRALTFGSLTPGGGDVTVNETNTAAGAAQLGYAQFDFNLPGVQIQVVAPTELAALDGVSNALPIAITCAEAAADGSDLVGMIACGTHTLTYGGAGVETRAIWLGGTIADADLLTATAGNYEATIDITIVP